MFRKLKRSFSKQGVESSNTLEGNTNRLEQMGFDRTQAQNALVATNGNLEEATNILLTNASMEASSQSTSGVQEGSNYNEEEEAQLARAIQQSLISPKSSTGGQTPPLRSAASLKAGKAAAVRAEHASKRFGANGKLLTGKSTNRNSEKTSSNSYQSSSLLNTLSYDCDKKLSLTHPTLKIPQNLQDKSKLEVIQRSTKRLAPHAHAVDTLLKALLHIKKEPMNPKYKKINKTSTGYKSSLQNVPGVLDFLKSMNFDESYGTSELILHQVDQALLYLGISSLEKVRESEEYLSNKRYIQFLKEIQNVIDGANVPEEEEVVKRAGFLSKCPAEPSSGSGALLQVKVGNEKISRRFDGDDVLFDVINWIGGHGSVIPGMILSQKWSLVDLNQYPNTDIDVKFNLDKTLQSIGCWPSGKFEIRLRANNNM